ncbi:unnamed protein product [marine sediment metagenome]|uniref:PCI domain-containing protein n=1 Tax=marine sediment metagenome TaxID=412755 RepID=X1CDR0_9ZZZZ
MELNRSIYLGIIGLIFHGVRIYYLFILCLGCFNLIFLTELITNLVFSIFSIGLIILLLWRKISSNLNKDDEAKVRQTILEMGTKFTRLTIKEISEKSEVDIYSIIKVIKDMIQNQEIYAEYFKSTKTVSFDQQTNINEIEKLMEIYREWETDKIEKK